MPKLFLVCTGLGIVKRGFETYISELAEKLYENKLKFKTELFSGGRYASKNITSKQLFCISRNNRFWRKFIGVSATSELELYSFFFSLLLRVILQKPTAIYLGEYKLYCYLFKVRKLLRLDFSLVLYTGGQASSGLYDIQKDFVHHVTDIYYNDLINEGYPSERQFVIPHFVNFTNQIDFKLKSEIRRMANGKKIIISVGIIDQSIKRMSSLVDILSKATDQYFPVLLGESSSETPLIIKKLENKFGKNNYFVQKVSKSDLPTYLNDADVFVLLSPKESFGLASLEALSVGLPVVCCDFKESRYVLKDAAYLVNCEDEQLVLETIKFAIATTGNIELKEKRKNFVEHNYSWRSLKSKYENMFNTILHV